MTAQLKAQKLYDRIKQALEHSPHRGSKARHVAVFLIDEVQKIAEKGPPPPDFWREVQAEIEKMR